MGFEEEEAGGLAFDDGVEVEFDRFLEGEVAEGVGSNWKGRREEGEVVSSRSTRWLLPLPFWRKKGGDICTHLFVLFYVFLLIL